MASSLWMIHGNLQTPKVWHPLQAQLKPMQAELNVSIILENLWSSPAESLQEWARLFCQRVEADALGARFLLGYSLGGRLALHALIHQPELWQGAIIISADPGLSSERDRKNCLAKDQQWSHKFRDQNWDNLLNEWNALPVFCGRKPAYSVLEQDVSRTQIAQTFLKFSKGYQADLRPQIQDLTLPILYLSGQEDLKYGQIGQTLAKHCPTVTHQAIANAGHRVPWENPQAFLLAIGHFLAQHS